VVTLPERLPGPVILGHYYHIYADGPWEPIVEEHWDKLRDSGLLFMIEFFRVGVVGSEENRARVRELLPMLEIVAEASEGWEQVTLEKLLEGAQTFDGAILYAHTKGAWSTSELARQWRVSMTYDTVTRWRECVEALYTVDTAGPYWLKSHEPEHKDHKHFFAGNFWWARTDYLRRLDPPKNEHRFQAEGWVGLGEPTVQNMREGYSYWGNFWSPDGIK
jgi:hypothetical protein